MDPEDEIVDRGDEFSPEEDDQEKESEEEFESSVEDEDEDLEETEDEDEGDEDTNEDEDDSSEDGDDDNDSENEDEDDVSEDEDDSGDDEDEEEDSGRIPRSRLNEVIAQRDAERDAREREEERVNRLEAMVEKLIDNGTTPKTKEVEVAPYDFDASEEKYINLILEGEVKDAMSLRKEIDQAKTDQFEATLENVRSSTEDNVLTQSRFDTAVEAMEAKYPFLDVENDDYNEEAVESINALMGGYVGNGTPKVEALNKAVKKMTPIYEKLPEDKKEDKEERLGSKKRKASPAKDRKRNAKASKAQPPKSPTRKKENQDLDTIVVSKLNEKDFDKLTKREKAVLRGD